MFVDAGSIKCTIQISTLISTSAIAASILIAVPSNNTSWYRWMLPPMGICYSIGAMFALIGGGVKMTNRDIWFILSYISVLISTLFLLVSLILGGIEYIRESKWVEKGFKNGNVKKWKNGEN